MPGSTLAGRGGHHDRPLSQFASQAFAKAGDMGYIAGELFPNITVDKQNDRYYTIDKAAWMQRHDTLRAPGQPANRIEWRVSSDSYFCDNYALADEKPIEVNANADRVLNVRRTSVMNVMDGLLRDKEYRVAQKVTSISNVGSGVVLSSASQWSAVNSADILDQVTTGADFIQSITGLVPNVMALDYKSLSLMRRNTRLISLFSNVSGGILTPEQILSLFPGIDRMLVSKQVYNTAQEGKAASMSSLWGDNCVLGYVNPQVLDQKVTTGGLCMNWIPEDGVANMQVLRSKQDEAGSAHVEIVETGYYGDEKIIAPELFYAITDTQA